MYKIMIFDQNEQFTGGIKKLISAKTYSELNGEDSLTLKMADKYVEKGFRILYHDRIYDRFYEYIVRDIDEYKDNGVVITEVYAENSIAETLGDFIEDKRNIGKSSKYALDKALEGTRWKVGSVPSDNLGTTTFYRTNVRNAINDIVKEYELELETEIKYDVETYKISRILHLRKKVGVNRGLRITYTKHIKELNRRTLSDEIFTALYGFGKGEELPSGGFGRRISFADINDGKGYVESADALMRFGRVDENGNKIHNFGKIEFDNVTDKEILKERTYEMLAKLSKPAVSYDITINDFYQITGSKEYYLSLGDDVFVVDKDFYPEIRYETRVLSIERDLVDVEESRVVLGELVRNIADTEDDLLEEIEDLTEEKLPEWEEGPGGGEGPGELPTYEKASDMIKKYPTLKAGLISWVDSNELKSLVYNGNKVIRFNDAITNIPVYTQPNTKFAPKSKVINGRRFLDFPRDPMTIRSWYEKDGRPKDTPSQEGMFMINSLKSKKIKSVVVVYEDRRPMLQSEMFPEDWETPQFGYGDRINKAENFYDMGRQSPLGYPFGAMSWDFDYHNGKIADVNPKISSPLLTLSDLSEYELSKIAKIKGDRNGVNNANQVSKSKHSGYNVIEKDESNEGEVIALSTNMKDGESVEMLYLGMSKESVSDYVIFSSQGGWSDDGASPEKGRKVYEMNSYFRGAISEVILYDRQLSRSEMRILENYVRDKYDLDIDPNFISGV